MSIKFFVDKTGKTAKCVSNLNFYAHKLNTKFPFIEQFTTKGASTVVAPFPIFPEPKALFYAVYDVSPMAI